MKVPNPKKMPARKDERPPKIAEWILGRFRPLMTRFLFLEIQERNIFTD